MEQGELGALAASLIDIPSVSRNETAIADFVEAYLAKVSHVEVRRSGNTVWAKGLGTEGPATLVAGHLDTVPGELKRARNGGNVFGRGAVDMKGGVAVMLALAATQRRTRVTYVWYPCEEIDASENGLRKLSQSHPEVLRCARGVVLEPTAGALEAGCQGTLRLRMEVDGLRAHTARPWKGTNALVRAAAMVARAEAAPRREPVIEGLQFRESLVPVHFDSFTANNVVPDRASVWFNHRFAPDRGVEAAAEWVRSVISDGAPFRTELEDAAPGAVPHLWHFSELSALVPLVRAKLGWTDVAFLAELGVPAVNFGPGDPELAHGNEEVVSEVEMAMVYEALNAWLP